jgi:hypothetical protein
LSLAAAAASRTSSASSPSSSRRRHTLSATAQQQALRPQQTVSTVQPALAIATRSSGSFGPPPRSKSKHRRPNACKAHAGHTLSRSAPLARSQTEARLRLRVRSRPLSRRGRERPPAFGSYARPGPVPSPQIERERAGTSTSVFFPFLARRSGASGGIRAGAGGVGRLR